MLAKISGHPAVPGSETEDPVVADLVHQVAENEVFRTAPVMRKLLLYLWDNRRESISEYAIATEALGRTPDFDSRTDASVRVQIARLRLKLQEFYACQAGEFALELRIPVGRHELEWQLKPKPASEIAPKPAPADAVPVRSPYVVSRWKNAFLAMGAVALLLAVVCAVLAWRLEFRSADALTGSAPVPPLPPFWSAFFANGKPANIVVPDLTGFRWPEQHIYVIAPDTPDFDKWPQSPFLRWIGEKWGPPVLNQTYLFGRDAFAAFRIDQYLEQHDQQVQLTESAAYGADIAANHNAVFLGLPSASSQIRRFSERTNFRIASGIPLSIENKHPALSEPARYDERQLSEKLRYCPAILAMLPRKSNGERILLLAGRYSNIFSSMLLTADGLKAIDDALRRAGSPDAWEMVIQAEIENNVTIVGATPLATRAIPTGFWN